MICLIYWVWPSLGLYFSALLILGMSAGIAAYFENNRLIPAVIWNLGLGCLAGGCLLFLLDFFMAKGWVV